MVTLAGHSGVRDVRAAPDGRIITGSFDRTVKVWRDGVCVRTLNAHNHHVHAVAVLPDGARFISVSENAKI